MSSLKLLRWVKLNAVNSLLGGLDMSAVSFSHHCLVVCGCVSALPSHLLHRSED